MLFEFDVNKMMSNYTVSSYILCSLVTYNLNDPRAMCIYGMKQTKLHFDVSDSATLKSRIKSRYRIKYIFCRLHQNYNKTIVNVVQTLI